MEAVPITHWFCYVYLFGNCILLLRIFLWIHFFCIARGISFPAALQMHLYFFQMLQLQISMTSPYGKTFNDKILNELENTVFVNNMYKTEVDIELVDIRHRSINFQSNLI